MLALECGSSYTVSRTSANLAGKVPFAKPEVCVYACTADVDSARKGSAHRPRISMLLEQFVITFTDHLRSAVRGEVADAT